MAAKANKKSSRRARKSVARRIMKVLGLGSKSRSSARRSRKPATRKSGKRGYTVVRALRGVKVEGYCRNCQGKRVIASPALVEMKANGSPAVLGKCSECGRGMFRFGAPAAPTMRKPQRDEAFTEVVEKSARRSSTAGGNSLVPAGPGTVGHATALRGPSGKLRNFASMSDAKLQGAYDQARAAGLDKDDADAFAELVRVMAVRGQEQKSSARRSQVARARAARARAVGAAERVVYDERLRVGGSDRLRNFRRMSDASIAQLVKTTKGTGDTEARKALLAVARERKAAKAQAAQEPVAA